MKEITLEQFIEKNDEIYNQFVVEYQEDIVRIVHKYRNQHHLVTAEDIISEVNFDLIYRKNTFLKNCFEDEHCPETLTFKIFRKYAFNFAKNKVSWTHSGVKNKNILTEDATTNTKLKKALRPLMKLQLSHQET